MKYMKKFLWLIIIVLAAVIYFAFILPKEEKTENKKEQEEIRGRLTLPADTIIPRFRSPEQINFMVVGEGMIYFVAGADFDLKGIVDIDKWR